MQSSGITVGSVGHESVNASVASRELQRCMSELVRRRQLSLEEAVCLWRGQSPRDNRPNKALNVILLNRLLSGYPLRRHLVEVARDGVRHSFTPTVSANQSITTKNHRSALQHEPALLRSLQAGQISRTYLIVDRSTLAAWGEFHSSPFGCVLKTGVDPSLEIRLIHDLSFPHGSSTNATSDPSQIPVVQYRHVAELARRIERLHRDQPNRSIYILKGDVKGAFRHIHVHPSVSRWFVGIVPSVDAAVIDLALPFGWTGSPAHYGAFGAAISYVLRRESPSSIAPGEIDTEPFFGYEWVDDHVMIEVDQDRRLELAETALRLSMVAILGPRAINETKFSPWSQELKALGLVWNTEARTVSMPTDKIVKALQRVTEMYTRGTATKQELQQVLGSLRHVCSCIRPARAFYQRLAGFQNRIKTHARIRLSRGATLDLAWFDHILRFGRLSGIPTSMFADHVPARVHLYMDASNRGLCVLHPARQEYVRVEFDGDELALIAESDGANGFNINVREQLSAAYGLLVWGPTWGALNMDQPVVVQCWLDNTAAIAWCNRLSSPNAYSQELNRVIGAAEAQFNVVLQADHLAGASNTMADAGSRAWSHSNGTRSMPSAQDLRATILDLQYKSLADSSQRVYTGSWRQWTNYRSRLGLSPWLPATDLEKQSIQLAEYAVYCWQHSHPDRRLRAASIQAKLSHVAWHHRVHRGFVPRLHAGHALIIAGMRRASPPPIGRQPVTIAMLVGLQSRLDLSNARHRVILGAACLGFFFLLRRSEYLAARGRRHRYAIEVKDVIVCDHNSIPTTELSAADMVSVRFRASKNDQEGRGLTRTLRRSGLDWVCPVQAAITLLQHARMEGFAQEDPLCSFHIGEMVSDTVMTRVLRFAASQIGTDPIKISCHSLRVGGATAMFAAGVDTTGIKLHGRWRSDAYVKYTRITASATATFASKMANTSL